MLACMKTRESLIVRWTQVDGRKHGGLLDLAYDFVSSQLHAPWLLITQMFLNRKLLGYQ
jgi:hypothetical protein